jgi:TPP-dependent pyruvate/acetoin dehydrogenase alpha subunit
VLDTNSARFRRLLYQTLLIRRIEERVIDLYPSDKIQSPVHLSIGQEPVAVGLCESMKPSDILFTTYRGHAYYVAKGGKIPELMAELYGRKGGVSGGKAGSMHLAAPEVGMMGSSAVVASTIPHGVGAALAAKVQNTKQAVITIFGDGATEEGVYHESLNFAVLHKLPVLFVCENNALAVHTSLAERHAFDLLTHAKAYGINTTVIEDGNDFIKVGDVAAKLLDSLRNGGGPEWLMVKTYRYKEHVGPNDDFDAGYRARKDMEPWLASDPLHKWPDLVKEMEADVKAEIDKAVAFAEASPAPGRDDLLTDVE